MPNYLKAAGIGNSVSGELGPGKYIKDETLEKLRAEWKEEIYKKKAIQTWHKSLYDQDKAANPGKFPDYLQRKSPGPGQYQMPEPILDKKTYAAPNRAAFQTNEAKKIEKPDPVQIPTLKNPGPGTYDHEMSSL